MARSLLPALLSLQVTMLVFAPTGRAGDRIFVAKDAFLFGDPDQRTASVRLADMDGDGDQDILVANGRHWREQNQIVLNSGGGNFSAPAPLGTDSTASYATEPADLDGDGDLDIAVGNDRDHCVLLMNDGHGNYSAPRTFGTPTSVRSLLVTDIDQDGDPDILMTCRRRPNRIFFNNGRGEFQRSTTFGKLDDSTIDVAVTDWNRDGHIDLVLANRDNQQNAILLNNGQSGFTQAIPFGTDQQQTRAVAVGDFNQDGRPDLVVANIGRRNEIYYASKTKPGTVSHSQPFGRPDGRSYALELADLDNDRDLDIVVGNTGQPNVAYFNDGAGKFRAAAFGQPTAATYGLDTADVDGDHFVDIVVANSGAQNAVYFNRPVENNSRTTGST